VKLETTETWETTFFDAFVDFRNEIHADVPTSFPETVKDYERFFAPGNPFADDLRWVAFLVRDGARVRAKAILSWRRDGTVGNLGFLDWENDRRAADLLVDGVVARARESGLASLKTPVDLNFYVKYRIKCPGGGKPFWGEPIYPDYYHDLFAATGFREIGRWDTYKIKRLKGIWDYLVKRKKLAKKPDGSHSKTKDKRLRTTVRCVRLSDWDGELRIIHNLFNEAYKNMPEWEPITFAQFKVIYDDFKYIINPYYAYIVELRGKPVGFSINFADPLPVLSRVKGKDLSPLRKALLLVELRANLSTLLIAHVGKIPGPNGEEIKGVQIQVSKRIQVLAAVMRTVLVTFQMKNSPSRRSFEERSQEAYSQYVLYGRDL
jgi:hypothetical protein